MYIFRYDELEAIHGKLDPLVHVDLTPKNIIQLVVGCKGSKVISFSGQFFSVLVKLLFFYFFVGVF